MKKLKEPHNKGIISRTTIFNKLGAKYLNGISYKFFLRGLLLK